MMALVQLWCRVSVVDPDGIALMRCDLEGCDVPDLGTVDLVASLALLAGRVGGSIILADVAPDLGALLELAGLDWIVGTARPVP